MMVLFRPPLTVGQAHNLFGIAEPRNIGIVAGKNELAPALLYTHHWDDRVGDEAVVQIILRLIYDQRRVRFEKQ